MANKQDVKKLANRRRTLHWQGRMAEADMRRWLEVTKREDELTAQELIEARQKATEAELVTVEVQTRVAVMREVTDLLGITDAVETLTAELIAQD